MRPPWNNLNAISDSDGGIRVLAIDHRDALRRFLSPSDPLAVAAADITALKIELVQALVRDVSGVMLEPEFSIPQVIQTGLIPPHVGVIAALEAQGYHDNLERSVTRMLENWSPEQARDAGAKFVKLLLPYVPSAPNASAQENVAREIVELSTAAEMPIVLEPLLYGIKDPAQHASLVVETAKRFVPLGPTLLKLPFPGEGKADRNVAAAACREVSSICTMPWAVLSGGGTFESFEIQLEIALSQGCSGFMVGRALWGDAVLADAADRTQMLIDVVRPRLLRLNALVMSRSAS